MGRRGYPPEFRRRVLDLIEAGRRVAEVAADLQISEQTIFTWRRQDRIDRGLEPGLSSAEQAELVVARRRIRELETELAVHRRSPVGRQPEPLHAPQAAHDPGLVAGSRTETSRSP